MASTESVDSLGLTPVLRDYADRLRVVIDDKLRYQQLLFLASKCPAMDDALKTPQNKVPGCLSTVYIHAIRQVDGKIQFQGDSDSQLTKGLVTMLINGLTSHYPEEIERVDPSFIQYAGIAKSLTPGRNNGFLNMLNVMKAKAREFSNQSKTTSNPTNSVTGISEDVGDVGDTSKVQGPVQESMHRKLSMLKPSVLSIENVSNQHAGHAGSKGLHGTETHFNVYIVAEAFAALNKVQRHRMVYQLLDQELNNGVHALSITAKSPKEVNG